MPGNKKILIVEDEKSLVKALELKLSHADFLLSKAFDGEDALSIMSKESFDCILLDLILPKVDGFEVLRIMKERGITTPVIVLTNLGMEEDEHRARKLGVSDFLLSRIHP
jgi:DNA-binding response OmpR family regulator